MADETTLSEKKAKFNFIQTKKFRFVAIIIIFIAIFYIGKYFLNSPEETNVSIVSDSVEEETKTDNGVGPVATINGEEVSREDYNKSVKELVAVTSRQGYSTSNPKIASQVRKQALAILINTRLLAQDAQIAQVIVSVDIIAEQYALVRDEAGGAEILIKVLEDLNITDAELRENIEQQLIIDTHIRNQTSYTDITITEDEVIAYYEAISATNESLLPLFDLKDELRTQLLAQKQQQVVSDFIQKLRDKAEIEILI